MSIIRIFPQIPVSAQRVHQVSVREPEQTAVFLILPDLPPDHPQQTIPPSQITVTVQTPSPPQPAATAHPVLTTSLTIILHIDPIPDTALSLKQSNTATYTVFP